MKDQTLCIALSTQSTFTEKVIRAEQNRMIQLAKLEKMIDKMIKNRTYEK
jgi:hypothetical protein